MKKILMGWMVTMFAVVNVVADSVPAYQIIEDMTVLAEKGNAEAQYTLGLVYDKGESVPEDDAEAVRWYRRAAEQGYAEAQNSLGEIYFNDGEGVPENLVQAYFWFNLAAAQNNEDAKNNKTILKILMTRSQIADAQKLSREFIAKKENRID